MPWWFGALFAGIVIVAAAANSSVSEGWNRFKDPGYLFGFILVTGGAGYVLGWVAWRFGGHKRFRR